MALGHTRNSIQGTVRDWAWSRRQSCGSCQRRSGPGGLRVEGLVRCCIHRGAFCRPSAVVGTQCRRHHKTNVWPVESLHLQGKTDRAVSQTYVRWRVLGRILHSQEEWGMSPVGEEAVARSFLTLNIYISIYLFGWVGSYWWHAVSFSCGMWDVPWPGMELGSPVLGGWESKPLDHQASSKMLRFYHKDWNCGVGKHCWRVVWQLVWISLLVITCVWHVRHWFSCLHLGFPICKAGGVSCPFLPVWSWGFSDARPRKSIYHLVREIFIEHFIKNCIPPPFSFVFCPALLCLPFISTWHIFTFLLVYCFSPLTRL